MTKPRMWSSSCLRVDWNRCVLWWCEARSVNPRRIILFSQWRNDGQIFERKVLLCPAGKATDELFNSRWERIVTSDTYVRTSITERLVIAKNTVYTKGETAESKILRFQRFYGIPRDSERFYGILVILLARIISLFIRDFAFLVSAICRSDSDDSKWFCRFCVIPWILSDSTDAVWFYRFRFPESFIFHRDSVWFYWFSEILRILCNSMWF